MIVDSMSYLDICKEYQKIIKTYQKRCYFLYMPGTQKYKAIHRYMVKNKPASTHYFKTIEMKVDANTMFYCRPRASSYREFKKLGLHLDSHIIFRYKGNMMALTLTGTYGQYYMFYTGHFMDRYNERFLNNEFTKHDAFIHFLSNHVHILYTQAHDISDIGDMIGVSENLIAFAEMIGTNVLLIKTCITPEMMYKQQNNIAERLIKLIEEAQQRSKVYNEALMSKDMEKALEKYSQLNPDDLMTQYMMKNFSNNALDNISISENEDFEKPGNN